MKQLLLVAHGSRRAASNDEVRSLANRVKCHLNQTASAGAFDEVCVAFLEMAAPTIGDSLNHSFAEGVEEVTVLPYFLAAGTHVTADIPNELQRIRSQWPEKSLTVLPHIGASTLMLDLITGLQPA